VKNPLIYFYTRVFTKTHNLIHLLVKAGCSKEYISTVITAILKSAGITAKGSISCQTVSHILMEGYVASQIQLGFEMAKAEKLTGSGDGTSHQNVQYYAQHINLKASDYKSSDGAKQHVTYFWALLHPLIAPVKSQSRTGT